MRKARGFTLVELAVALTIMALLIGMLVVPLNTQMDQQRISETTRQARLVAESVLGFAVTTGRLPCPATPTTANTVAGAGLENRAAGACVLTEGVVPWATLGMPEADAWGRRLSYRVTPAFADDPAGGLQASFLLTDDGNITITDAGVTTAQNMAAVIVSHGKNGAGGYQTDGVRVALGTGDELENADGDGIFVSKVPTPDFDDLLVWVSPSLLKSRMVAANRLP